MGSRNNAPGRLLNQGSQAASYLLGGVVIAAAGASVLWDAGTQDLAGWVLDVLGLGFVGLLGGLVFLALFAFVRLRSADSSDERAFWLGVGVQAANGVTTLALTFTLLGISLGIGSLAGQDLTPETVQGVIRDLTANFSLAFMTTVIGLPVAALLRSALIVQHGRLELAESRRTLVFDAP
ncbi:MAG: hypothetical protein ACPGNT_08285 [Rhodospirillales bacterium]